MKNFVQYPAGIYLLKVSYRNARTKCEIFSNLTIKTAEGRQENSVYIVNFQQVNVGWGKVFFSYIQVSQLSWQTYLSRGVSFVKTKINIDN